MGEVYRAYDDCLKRHVAVKLLKSELRSNTEARVRFEREAITLASLRHAGVVTVYEYGEKERLGPREGLPYDRRVDRLITVSRGGSHRLFAYPSTENSPSRTRSRCEVAAAVQSSVPAAGIRRTPVGPPTFTFGL